MARNLLLRARRARNLLLRAPRARNLLFAGSRRASRRSVAAWQRHDGTDPPLKITRAFLTHRDSPQNKPGPHGSSPARKVDVRLPGKGNSNSHGARPVHLIFRMIKWFRTSRLSINNSFTPAGRGFLRERRFALQLQPGTPRKFTFFFITLKPGVE